MIVTGASRGIGLGIAQRFAQLGAHVGLVASEPGGLERAYCTSKWALVGLVEVLHDELAGNGVSVCAVCPGAVRTDQLAEEHAWGPTGGASYQNAMASDAVARRIVLAAGGSAPVVVVDKPHCEWPSTLWASWADRGGCALPSSGRRSKR